MNLKGSLIKLQKSGAQFYLKLAQFFEANQLISETWVAMSHDLDQQAASLETLPRSLWKRIGAESEVLLGAIQTCKPLQAINCLEDRSLVRCFARTLDFEEPLILKAYEPVIRLLRTESSDQALDFYIIVKAHVARLFRVIQPFSADPAQVQRVMSLQQRFEQEVQSPSIENTVVDKKASRKKHGSRRFAKPKRSRKLLAAARSLRTSKRLRHLAKRIQPLSKRAKPLVRKLDISRRRARR